MLKGSCSRLLALFRAPALCSTKVLAPAAVAGAPAKAPTVLYASQADNVAHEGCNQHHHSNAFLPSISSWGIGSRPLSVVARQALQSWNSSMDKLDCVCFTFIIDDIVFPDGRTCMAQLGGGGPQSLFGFQLVSSTLRDGQLARIALAAGVGPDVPDSCVRWLERLGVDTAGLVLHDRPTPRSWQVFEADGRRTQVWRNSGDPCEELWTMLRPRIDNLPPAYREAHNYHIGIHPLYPPKILKTLRATAHASGGVLSVEPYTAAERQPTVDELQTLLRDCDIFSPNLAEAEALVGTGDPPELADRLFKAAGTDGARLIIIRCAEHGVYAQLGLQGPACQVPAVADTHVVDVTGAGNSFCGAFLAAFNTSPATRVLRAAIAAGGSAALETHDSAAPDAETASNSSLDNHSDDQDYGRLTAKGVLDGLATAASWGCSAASLMIEEPGVPQTPLPQLHPKARQRFQDLLPRVQYCLPGQAAPEPALEAAAGVTVSSSGSWLPSQAARGYHSTTHASHMQSVLHSRPATFLPSPLRVLGPCYSRGSRHTAAGPVFRPSSTRRCAVHAATRAAPGTLSWGRQ